MLIVQKYKVTCLGHKDDRCAKGNPHLGLLTLRLMLSELHQVLRYDNLSGQPLKITHIHVFGLHAYIHACILFV